MDLPEMIHALERCEFFEGLGKEDLEKIARLCRVETCRGGEYVFRQGDFGEDLYIIAEGQVFLERTVDLGMRKGSVVIETLGRGRVFGCWSALLDKPHYLMSSASCQKPTKILVLRGPEIRRMMLANKELGFKVMEKLCFLLRDRIQSAYGAMEKI